MNGQSSLSDFERACQQTTDKMQREQIALAALNFLLQNSLPNQASIEEEIYQEIEKESVNPSHVPSLPEGEFELNENLCAELEARLADFFPTLTRLNSLTNPATALSLLARARIICQKVDTWRQYNYWTPLFDFLKNAASDQWRKWRSAALAQQKARTAIGDAKFDSAKQFAIYGLQRLSGIPDHRLYLDLCSRVENALAEGDAYYCVAIALGHWVVKESLVAGHYLRAAGMRHNLGNQLLITGRNNEAITVLEQNQQLCNDCWSLRDISFYYVNAFERLACAYLNSGDAIRAADYFAKYEFYAQQPREQALQRLGKGGLDMRNGTHAGAEQKYSEARQFAKGKDFFNFWMACASRGWVCIFRDKPDEALAHVQEAISHGETLTGFMNVDRRSYCFLLEAQAQILRNELALAQAALDSAETCMQGLDSPRRNMQLLLTKASLRAPQGNNGEAQTYRDQAIQLALTNGFDASNLDRLKMAIFV